MFEYLFSPANIGTLKLKNRIIMPSVHHYYSPDGYVNERLVRYYATRAKGGVAMVTLGGCAVSQTGKLGGMVCLSDDKFMPKLQATHRRRTRGVAPRRPCSYSTAEGTAAPK